jgi:hypothetical protein
MVAEPDGLSVLDVKKHDSVARAPTAILVHRHTLDRVLHVTCLLR